MGKPHKKLRTDYHQVLHESAEINQYVERNIKADGYCVQHKRLPNIDTANTRMPTTEVATDSTSTTTFVQVDTNAFKEIVQQLTGLVVTQTNTVHGVGTTTAKGGISINRKPAFKLYERRQYNAKLEIIKPSSNFKQGSSIRSPNHQKFSPTPSPLSTPTNCLSKLSLFEREIGESSINNTAAEERAIREKKFYLHPSLRSKKPGLHEPELLNLFPLTSPIASKES
ncbi:hypothetical protein Cgig2_015132 [Carnegiea gigantea]|uniref:VQ domain-containing protein n=1 Tax=Carnegiea gigantea TaxID=171969 RepID=A0A9Q1KQE2_9CARY|nr:hypothetical protein Cgig2_015132 [Carnegiea gigantea]